MGKPSKKPEAAPQMTLKEMLLKRKKQETENEEEPRIKIPRFLRRHEDIRPPPPPDTPSYGVRITMMARVFFRSHSNIDDVMNTYLDVKEKTSEQKASYTAPIISVVTSCPIKRRSYPFRNFRFNSTKLEAVGRTLLIYPGIKKQEDLDQLNQFHNEHRLKFCSVSLVDNVVHTDALNYTDSKRLPNGKPYFTNQGLARSIVGKYYERENLIEYVHIATASLERIEETSNFQRHVMKMMAKVGESSESNYKTNASLMLLEMRKSTEFFYVQKLIFLPRFVPIANFMNDEEQNEAASSIDMFYLVTNAEKHRKKAFPRPTREEFYELFNTRSQEERKLPPFNFLSYEGEPSPDEEAVTSPKPTSLNYRNVQRFEKNTRLEKACSFSMDVEDNENSSGTSNVTMLFNPNLQSTPKHQFVTVRAKPKPKEVAVPLKDEVLPKVITQPANSPMIVIPPGVVSQTVILPPAEPIPKSPSQICNVFPQRKIPQHLLISDLEDMESIECLKLICGDKGFVSLLKSQLKAEYEHNFDTLWKENKVIIISNFVEQCWIGNLENLAEMVENCRADIKEKALEMIANQMTAKARLHSDSGEESANESTEGVEITDLIPGNVPVAKVLPVIKQEKFSQPQHPLTESSDVQFLGTFVQSEIIVDDSQDADESLIQQLQEPEESNQFLKDINAGTQPEDLNSEENPSSEEPVNRIKSYEPLSVQQLRADKEALAERAIQQSTVIKSPVRRSNRPGPKSKRQNFQPANIQYLDDEEEGPSPGKETTHAEVHRNLNDDFSVFLSSQLLIDRQEAPSVEIKNTINPFSIVPSSSSTQNRPPYTESQCFVVNILQVSFIKNVKFEFNVNLPQYNLYNVTISGTNIKAVLDVTDDVYSGVLYLLNIIEKYEFVPGVRRESRFMNCDELFLMYQLDMFFTSQIKFKSFKILASSSSYTCTQGIHTSATTGDLTSAIRSEIVKCFCDFC